MVLELLSVTRLVKAVSSKKSVQTKNVPRAPQTFTSSTLRLLITTSYIRGEEKSLRKDACKIFFKGFLYQRFFCPSRRVWNDFGLFFADVYIWFIGGRRLTEKRYALSFMYSAQKTKTQFACWMRNYPNLKIFNKYVFEV